MKFLTVQLFLLSMIFTTSVTALASSNETSEETRHSFIGFGKATGIVIVNEAGTVEWKMQLPASDGWLLDSGNIIAAIYPCQKFPKGGVAEINRQTKKIIWEYQGQQKEISTVQPLGDDQYLVAEL